MEVRGKSRILAKPALVISAHLLEGHSPDENSPYVRGDYGTHEKLTRLVRYRSAKVLKSVLTETQLPGVGRLIVQARHGVRQHVGSFSSPGKDVAMTIYEVGLPLDNAQDTAWHDLSEEEVMALWTVKTNIIPSLRFSTVPY